MTKVVVSDITHTVSVQEAVYHVQIASGASDTQIISSGGAGNSLISSTAGVVTTMKTISAGSNITLSDDGNTITVSATDTEDDLSNNTTDELAEGSNNLYYTDARATQHISSYTGNIGPSGSGINTITGSTANFTTINGDLNAARIDSSGTNLTIDPNGFLHIDDTNVYVGSFTQAAHITDTSIGSIGNPLTITSGNIIPAANVTYTLGSPTNMWRDAYIGPGSLYIDGHKVLGSDATGQIDITTDDGQNLNIFAGANGPGGDIIVGSAGGVTTLQDATVNLGPTTNSGTINIRGTLEAADIHNGSLEFSGTVIDQTAPNQNLEIRTNGTGYLHANVSSAYFGSFSDYTQITGSQITGNVTGQVSDISNHTTTDLTEGTNLYYTDERVDDRVNALLVAGQGVNLYYNDTANTLTIESPTPATPASGITSLDIQNWNTAYGWGDHSVEGYATQTYVDTEISNLVDAAPATLDTLNELAAALGDDANFSTTVSNQIGTKWTQDNTKISNWDTAYSWGNHADEGYLTSFTETDPTVPAHVKSITSQNITNWNTAYSWGDHSTVGYLTTVSESDVTQHQAALSITESQISDLTHYTDTDARSAVSLNSSNLNELSYDSATGVFTYVSPSTVSAAGQIVIDVRNASGVAISRGDAVYLAGHSGGKILVAKADANATGQFPAIGLANSAMSNNSDGTVLISGEMDSLDTSAFAVNDVLYLSETAGELTATRPSASGTAVQNIGKVARSDNQNGVIVVTGSGRANDVPNLDSGHVFIGNGSGYEKRALNTDDVAEATNLYYTDARAITAVQNEATLDLTGDVTIDGDLTVDELFKVKDGFTQGSFNPYAGFGAPAMPIAFAGVGQEGGWAGMGIRSRGIHDFGIGSQYNFPPNAIVALQSGRLDGSSDDYLNNNDAFGQLQFNPYSAYRTGTEWITPSALIEGVATEDHSSSGMGTKLNIYTTENGNTAGATDSTHTNASISIQGTTVSSSGDLKLDDDVEITGTLDIDGNTTVNGSDENNSVVIGDAQVSQQYDVHGFTVRAGDTAWASVTLDEHVGGADKPAPSFANPVIAGQVWGGTPESQSAVPSGKRLITIAGQGSYDDNGTITQPPSSPIRIVGETTETQTSGGRGARFQIETTPNGSTGRINTRFQGNEVIINTDGDGVLKSGGNLTLDDDVTVTGDLEVQGTISGVIHPFLLGGM